MNDNASLPFDAPDDATSEAAATTTGSMTMKLIAMSATSLLQTSSSNVPTLRGASISRELTFLDENDGDYYNTINHTTKFSNGLSLGFILLAAAFCMTALLSIRLTTRVREFYEWNAIRLIFPTVSLILAMECGTLAFDTRRVSVGTPWAIVIYMLQATVAPGLFLSTFVITYLAHRTRSIPFCVVYRGPGRSLLNLGGIPVAAATTTGTTTTAADPTTATTTTGGGDSPTGRAGNSGDNVLPHMQRHRQDMEDDDDLQGLVRPATMVVMIRLFALGLLILSLMVNFNIVWDESAMAGRTGWMTIFMSFSEDHRQEDEDAGDSDPYSTEEAEEHHYLASWSLETIHIFLSLLPMAVVSIICMYFSLLLWRYGTLFSMVIYGSLLNPWVSPVIGTCCLIGGQVFGPDWFPLMSNLGILLYILSILLLLREVQKDVGCSNDLGQFLDALGDDQVAGSVAPPIDLTTTITDGDLPPPIQTTSGKQRKKDEPESIHVMTGDILPQSSAGKNSTIRTLRGSQDETSLPSIQ